MSSGCLRTLLLLGLAGSSVSGPAATAAGASANRPDGALLAQSCSSCHNPEVADSAIPELREQSAAELRRKLLEFRSGAATGTVMNRIARGYSVQELESIAAFLSKP